MSDNFDDDLEVTQVSDLPSPSGDIAAAIARLEAKVDHLTSLVITLANEQQEHRRSTTDSANRVGSRVRNLERWRASVAEVSDRATGNGAG